MDGGSGVRLEGDSGASLGFPPVLKPRESMLTGGYRAPEICLALQEDEKWLNHNAVIRSPIFVFSLRLMESSRRHSWNAAGWDRTLRWWNTGKAGNLAWFASCPEERCIRISC